MKASKISYHRTFKLPNGESETVSITVEPEAGDGVYKCELNSLKRLWSDLKEQAEEWHQRNKQ